MEKIIYKNRSYYLPTDTELEEKVMMIFKGNDLNIQIKDNIFVKVFGQNYILPKGLRSDGASIPKILQVLLQLDGFDKRIFFNAVLHDYFYRTQFIPRDIADRIFLHLNLLTIDKFRAYLMYIGLRIGGFIAWNNNKKRLSKFPQAVYDLKKHICE